VSFPPDATASSAIQCIRAVLMILPRRRPWAGSVAICRSALISWADMVLVSSVAGLFKWRQFESEVILLAVGWYLRFSLSYRDVEELLAERGISVDHVTLWRWV
jgi:hypothetical protein